MILHLIESAIEFKLDFVTSLQGKVGGVIDVMLLVLNVLFIIDDIRTHTKQQNITKLQRDLCFDEYTSLK